MLTWIPKVKLMVNESAGKPAEVVEKGEDEEEPAETDEVKSEGPICAVVRVRICKKKPEQEEDDDGNLIDVEVNEDELEEVPIEDKCHSIITS